MATSNPFEDLIVKITVIMNSTKDSRIQDSELRTAVREYAAHYVPMSTTSTGKQIYRTLDFATIFEVIGNTDGNEGRGTDLHLGYFETRPAAAQHARGKGVMGSQADVRAVSCIWVSETEAVIVQYGKKVTIYTNAEDLDRRNALEKAKRNLTPQELQLLGIK